MHPCSKVRAHITKGCHVHTQCKDIVIESDASHLMTAHCCSVLQCVAGCFVVCCSVVQCKDIVIESDASHLMIAQCCSVLQCVAGCFVVCSVAVCSTVLKCVAVYVCLQIYKSAFLRIRVSVHVRASRSIFSFFLCHFVSWGTCKYINLHMHPWAGSIYVYVYI